MQSSSIGQWVNLRSLPECGIIVRPFIRIIIIIEASFAASLASSFHACSASKRAKEKRARATRARCRAGASCVYLGLDFEPCARMQQKHQKCRQGCARMKQKTNAKTFKGIPMHPRWIAAKAPNKLNIARHNCNSFKIAIVCTALADFLQQGFSFGV